MNIFSRKTYVDTDETTPILQRKHVNWKGERPQNLPPLEGREIMEIATASNKDPQKKGIRQTYSMTLTELTQENATLKKKLHCMTQKQEQDAQQLEALQKASAKVQDMYTRMETTAQESQQVLKATQKKLRTFSTSYEAYTNLPADMQAFMQRMEKDMETQKTDVNKALTDVYNQLNALLNGDAKPHQETVDTVTQQLLLMSQRLDRLENSMRR